jgi:hypothetical protein
MSEPTPAQKAEYEHVCRALEVLMKTIYGERPFAVVLVWAAHPDTSCNMVGNSPQMTPQLLEQAMAQVRDAPIGTGAIDLSKTQ